jgi:predicted dehydrogenase
VDDYATGFVRFDNQASLCFEVAWACNAKPESYVEILGTKGGIKLEGGNATFLTEYDNMLADINLAYNANVDGFVAELSKFVKAINGEGEIPATGDQGVIVMKLLDAIYKSCELNREVDI